MINETINATVTPYPVTLTGVPFYDGFIEGLFFIPSWCANLLGRFGVYNWGFAFGIFIFVGVVLMMLSWGDQ